MNTLTIAIFFSLTAAPQIQTIDFKSINECKAAMEQKEIQLKKDIETKIIGYSIHCDSKTN